MWVYLSRLPITPMPKTIQFMFGNVHREIVEKALFVENINIKMPRTYLGYVAFYLVAVCEGLLFHNFIASSRNNEPYTAYVLTSNITRRLVFLEII